MVFFSACGKRPSETSSVDNNVTVDSTKQIQIDTSTTTGQRNYNRSMIHREFDNDSLLLDLPDLRKLIKSFTSKQKVREKEYGAGDYFGKYRVYADKLDTLIIDKGDGGDYGFGNTIYLKRKDSIVLYRDYYFNSFVDSTGWGEEVTELIVTFKHATVSSKRRQMQTADWSQLFLKNIPFENIPDDPSKRYKLLKDELNKLYKRELVE